MAERAAVLVHGVLRALVESDAVRAREVAVEDDEIDRLYRRFQARCIARTIPSIVAIGSAARRIPLEEPVPPTPRPIIRATSSGVWTPAPHMTMMPGSTRPTCSTACSTNQRISVAAERPVAMSAGGSASTMSGPSSAIRPRLLGRIGADHRRQSHLPGAADRPGELGRRHPPLRVVEHRADRTGLQDRLGQHGPGAPTGRDRVHVLGEDVEVPGAPGDGRDVDRLGIEDDGHVELAGRGVRRPRQPRPPRPRRRSP